MSIDIRTGEDVCPSNSQEIGKPNGTCWGDEHYACKGCKYYRADFKRNGQDYIDFIHDLQTHIQLTTLS